MQPKMGEYAVGAYLKVINTCDVVDYNVKPPGGGLQGLGELDVIGLDFKTSTVYVCEVITHLRGTLYGDNPKTIKKVKEKHKRQRQYVNAHLKQFKNAEFMLWSPSVPVGILTTAFAKIKTLDLVINKTYSSCIDQLRVKAKQSVADINNPFFRTLQILEHLRK